jgi:hypothetical protein
MKRRNLNASLILTAVATILLMFGLSGCTAPKETKGMMLLIEFEETQGLLNWADEFESRNMPAVIQIQHNMVDEHCDLIKNLSDRGFEISGLYSPEAFWDKEYQFQYDAMKEVRDKIELCTGQKMRAFGSRYFAYDENTLKAAEALGVEYVFARGTTGARATVYKPVEYDVKIIAVSNVPSKEMGTGSLCDYSLWARGETPDSFESIATEALAENDKVILVSHAYLGGTKLRWWNAYQNVLDNSKVNWLSIDEFAAVDYEMNNADIPVNREVKYETPSPEVPLEEEPECSSAELACY